MKKLLAGLLVAAVGAFGSIAVFAEEGGDDAAAKNASSEMTQGKMLVVVSGDSVSGKIVGGPDDGKEVSVPVKQKEYLKDKNGQTVVVVYLGTGTDSLSVKYVGVPPPNFLKKHGK